MSIKCYANFIQSSSPASAQAEAQDQEIWVRLVGETTEARTPIHLIAVIDVSGSMDEERRLENVKHTLRTVLDFMTPADMISLVTFSVGATTVLKQQHATAEGVAHARAKINALHTEGNTNLSAGILGGFQCLDGAPSGVKQVMLLLTDGEANAGLVEPSQLTTIVKQGVQANPMLTVTAIGYGASHNSSLLVGVQQVGNGFYSVVNNLEDVASTFGEVFGSMTTTVAQNIKVRGPEGSLVVGGYAMDSTSVVIGDIGAGAHIELIMKVPAGHDLLSVSFYDCLAMAYGALRVEIGGACEENAEPVRLYRLRQDVSAYLKDIATQTKVRAEELVARCLSDEGLEGMLKHDLQAVILRLSLGRGVTAMESAEMAQNATYYRMARGVHTQTQYAPGDLVPPPLINIFSSPLAAHVSGCVSRNITSRVSGVDEDPVHNLSQLSQILNQEMEDID
jgi:hypothetical protein